jgi:transcriptional regulator with XRE-family HTH domain
MRAVAREKTSDKRLDAEPPRAFTGKRERGRESPDGFLAGNFDAERFAGWLRGVLRAAGMKQSEMAKRSGVAAGTVSKLARGKGTGTPDALTVRALAEAAGGSVLEAFAAAGFLADLGEPEGEALETALALLAMTERERRIVRVLIDELRR